MLQQEIHSPVAFVSGSSRGIGRAIAIDLAKAGFDVVIHGRNSEKTTCHLKSLEQEINKLGRDVLIVQGSIDDAQFRNSLIENIFNRFSRLDCVVNNAGTASLRRGDLLDLQEDSYDHCLNINAKAMFFMCQNAAKAMLSENPLEDIPLTIINVTSCSSVILSPSRGDYCISKAAASMISQLFALRLAETPIRVFEIRPGIIKTDMTSVVSEKYDRLIASGLVPEKRWGKPEDISSAVTTLALGKFPYTVGQVINIDGGLYIRNF